MLYDIFTPGDISPRGRPAKDVDLDASLALADTYIHGDSSSTDLKEGEYWIRHGIGRVMADTRLRWALTQLGSVYAAPGETAPDFEKARLMWEMSGALGDAVALCFLGNLHEYGLGVPANREMALKWYERGLAAGGCKGIDEAIARVKR
jgi:TPR repeat protein